MQGGTQIVQQYLDTPGLSYLYGINGTTSESLTNRTAEIARLKKYLPLPNVIASIGVGQGEELHAINLLYSGSVRKIIGLDLSELALGEAKQRVIENDLPVDLVLGSATNLPLADESIDGIILSSVLHEIYSYTSDGREAWNKAIQEAARVLREGGCMLLRDSALPNLDGTVQIQLLTHLAREFYPYFAKEYRAFNGWEDLKGKFSSNIPSLPEVDSKGVVTLSIGQASEFLFHFVNFQLGYPNDQEFIGNQRWKELNEVYYIPKTTTSQKPMSVSEYTKEVVEQAALALRDTDFKLVCVERDLSIRPRMPAPIREHFILTLPDIRELSPQANVDLTEQFCKKMELVFKKVRKEQEVTA